MCFFPSAQYKIYDSVSTIAAVDFSGVKRALATSRRSCMSTHKHVLSSVKQGPFPDSTLQIVSSIFIITMQPCSRMDLGTRLRNFTYVKKSVKSIRQY